MLKNIMIYRDVLLVFGRLRIGVFGLWGAFCAMVLFGGASVSLTIGWLYYSLFGQAILPGHELLDGGIDISALIVLPAAITGLSIVQGRVFLSRDDAIERQEHWSEAHWGFGMLIISSVYLIFNLLCHF